MANKRSAVRALRLVFHFPGGNRFGHTARPIQSINAGIDQTMETRTGLYTLRVNPLPIGKD